MEEIIRVRNLTKTYTTYKRGSGFAETVKSFFRREKVQVEAVKDVSFEIEEGQIAGILGPNGAGKSTTIDIICTFLKPDRGAVVVDGCTLGREDTKIRETIGAVFQDGLLDNLLTIEENLKVRGSFYGLRGRALKNAIQQTAEIAGGNRISETAVRKAVGRPAQKVRYRKGADKHS